MTHEPVPGHGSGVGDQWFNAHVEPKGFPHLGSDLSGKAPTRLWSSRRLFRRHILELLITDLMLRDGAPRAAGVYEAEAFWSFLGVLRCSVTVTCDTPWSV